jgi:hypothetical protein
VGRLARPLSVTLAPRSAALFHTTLVGELLDERLVRPARERDAAAARVGAGALDDIEGKTKVDLAQRHAGRVLTPREVSCAGPGDSPSYVAYPLMEPLYLAGWSG